MPELQYDVSLKPYNTFGIDVRAKVLCRIQSETHLPEIRSLHRQYYPDVLVLGGGSNILLTRDFDGLVLLNQLKGIQIKQEDDHSIGLFAASGENWHELVMLAVRNNWGGIENLSLIPGSVGAAPIQNIGAYGVELKDVLKEVYVFEWETGQHRVFSKKECLLGYRDSIFKRDYKGQYFITGITMQLVKNPEHFHIAYGDIRKVLEDKNIHELSVAAVSEAVISIRRSKLPDPTVLGNAGSFFKNPVVTTENFLRLKEQHPDMPFFPQEDGSVKIPAAWLIERCGWKGRRIGHTGNHASQALVIVNYGGATGEEVWQHALAVQKSVKERFGILLEPEVQVV